MHVRFTPIVLLLAIALAACTDPDTVDIATTSSTVASSPSESAELEAANARIAELETALFTAASTTVPLTTTTTNPKELVVFSHRTGEYIDEPSITWVWGWVSDPQAEVDVNNMPLPIGEFIDPGWDFRPPEEENWSIPLNEGRNMLMFTATFLDGLTIVDDIVVFHDPTLTKELGVLTGYESDEPRTMTFDIGAEWEQDAGGGITVESTATYPVAEDAAFKLEAADTSSWHLLYSNEFFELMDFMQSEGCAQCLEDGCCPDRCIWASWDGGAGLEFAIYLNTDGEIQQLTQLHLRN